MVIHIAQVDCRPLRVNAARYVLSSHMITMFNFLEPLDNRQTSTHSIPTSSHMHNFYLINSSMDERKYTENKTRRGISD